MNDQSPGVGHNGPPPFDATALAEWDAKVKEFVDASSVWNKMDAIETDEHAGQITDQIDGLRGLFKKVDEARKAEKKPHDDAGKAVQAAYSPLLDKLKKAADKLKPKLAAFAEAKAKAEAEARAKAEAEAKAATEAAEKALKEAEAAGDIGAEAEAEAARKEAEKAQKAAARPVSGGVKSATGAGRTMSLRTVKEVEITNVRVLFMHYQDHPEVAETLRRLATADVRSKDYDPANPVPGITVTERKVMA